MTLDKSRVGEMFDGIARRYDLLNRLLSLGIDIYWRKQALKRVDRGAKLDLVVDMATGTADLAIMMAKGLKVAQIVGLDLSEQMLSCGRKKVLKAGLKKIVELRCENCEETTLPDASADLVTIAFGIRNFRNADRGLREFFRLLKPNGQLIVLEFSRPHSGVLKPFYRGYFKCILPLIGRLVSSHPSAYRYLQQSVDDFPSGERFVWMLREAGFGEVTFESYTLGIATVYVGRKPC